MDGTLTFSNAPIGVVAHMDLFARSDVPHFLEKGKSLNENLLGDTPGKLVKKPIWKDCVQPYP